MSYPNTIDSYPAINNQHQEPLPADICEVTGTVESIEHSGVSKHDTPFVKLIFRATTGELYRFTKFDATQEHVEQFLGNPVRALFECSVDAHGNRHKNIVGDFKLLKGNHNQQNHHRAPVSHSQPQRAYQGQPYTERQPQPQYHHQESQGDPLDEVF